MSMAMEDARHFCQQRHSDLVSITSKEENVFLWKQISRSYGRYYIGLSVDLDGSAWWMDGTPVSFRRWDEDQPSTSGFDQNCVFMSYHMGFWRTSNCGRELSFICKRGRTLPTNTTAAPTVAPTGGCPNRWMKFGTKCYNIFNERQITWEYARSKCIEVGGNLVSIPTRSVQAFLITRMVHTASTDLWIGLNAISQEGFFWTDGKKRQYTNWGYSRREQPFGMMYPRWNERHHRHPGTFYKRWNEDECVVMNGNPVFGIGKWTTRSCNDTNGYICQRNLDPNMKAPPETIDYNIYETLGNDSIKIITQNLTWDDAQKRCKADKANLASLRNDWTQAYAELLAIKLNTPLWIGLNKQQTGGYFKYIDGWHLNNAGWAEFEPSRDKPCVYVDVDGKWRTAFCNVTIKSACMQSTEVAPTESTIFPGNCPEDTDLEYQQSYTWLPYRGYCYLFIQDEIEWADAASSCVRHGGVLASIEDPSEQEFIKGIVTNFKDRHNSFWIGLFKTHKGTWLWLDRTILDFANWAQDEPDSDYGAIQTSDGTWNSGRRWHDRPYICKTAKVMPQTSGSKDGSNGNQDHQTRVHTTVVVVLVITITSTLVVIAFFLYKKSPGPFPTFENPLYFNGERSQPDVLDTNKLIENAENPEPVLTL